MRLPDEKTRRLLLASVLCALAMALSLVDFAVSAVLPFLPGIKLGLANVVTLFCLYALSLPYALMVCAVRALVTALLSGSVSMLFFSLAGGIASVVIMWVLKRRLRLVKVSVSGAVTHNMAQLAVAAAITGTPAIAAYAPVLILAGCASGFIMGVLCGAVLYRLKVASV